LVEGEAGEIRLLGDRVAELQSEKHNQKAATYIYFAKGRGGNVRGVRREIRVRGDADGVLVQRSENKRSCKSGVEGEVQGVRVQELLGEVCGGTVMLLESGE
jgi:hypothetical protein